MTDSTTTIAPGPLKDSGSLLTDNQFDVRVLQPYLEDGTSHVAFPGKKYWLHQPTDLPAYLSQQQWDDIRTLCGMAWVNSLAWNHLSQAGSVSQPLGLGVATVAAGDGWGSCALPIHSIRILQPDCELLPALLKVSKSIDKSIMGVGEAFSGFGEYKAEGYCNHPNRVVVEVPRGDRAKALEIIQSHLNGKGGVRRVYYGAGYTPALGQYSPSLPDRDAVYVDLTCVQLQVGQELTMLQWGEYKVTPDSPPGVPAFVVMAVAALRFHEERVAAGGIIHFKAVD